MRILLSEASADYGNYIFPYAVWGFPDEGESPADLFDKGFLPSSNDLQRFYLCRNLRVDLAKFQASSENRRILRKGANISCTLIPRKDFDLTAERRAAFKTYADIKFGRDVMTHERLDRLFAAKVVTHLLLFNDGKTGAEVGVVTLFVQPGEMAFYYYAFYDLNYYEQNLGMFMMTRAVEWAQAEKLRHLYLGSCYTKNALYKAQFKGAEFFNGFRWSGDLKELRHLIQRGETPQTGHLLESEEFRRQFAPADLKHLAAEVGWTSR